MATAPNYHIPDFVHTCDNNPERGGGIYYRLPMCTFHTLPGGEGVGGGLRSGIFHCGLHGLWSDFLDFNHVYIPGAAPSAVTDASAVPENIHFEVKI